MPRTIVNDVTGERAVLMDDGSIIPAPEAGLMAQAGRQVADLGSGIMSAYGNLTDNPELVARAEAETARRNQLFQGTDILDPYTSMAGQAIPGLATFPITGGAGLAGQVATNIGIGAAESALDLGEGGTFLERGVAGGAGGLIGDVAGRTLGRVFNMARGLANDIRMGRGTAENVAARQADELGIPTLASQRLEPGTQAQRQMERLEQGAAASIAPPGVFREVAEGKARVFNEAAQEAIGLAPGEFDRLGPDALLEANRRISEGFADVAANAASQGPIQIGEELATRIANTRGQIPQLQARGRFQGLADGVLSGNEWNVARRALAQDAANAAAKGDYELADDIFADVEQLDRIMEPLMGTDTLENFARLREQYRVFKILSKPGVIRQDGEVSIRNLNRALNAGTGFGTTAQQGLPTVNPESKRLIDVARVGSDPSLQEFRSSGTAENQALREFIGDSLSGPLGPVRAAAQLAAPAAVGAASSGGGRGVIGLTTPAPVQAVTAGGAVGRSLLDEALYPFVGVEDERRP
jgi:PAS domain-containing protein